MTRYRKHIIIVGTARSGTSWLSETMARQHRYRMLFEPEHETRTPRGHLLYDRWITAKEEAPKAHKYLNAIFSNRVDCDWIAQNSNRRFKRHLWPFLPKKYIIKFVRANLLAKYMNETFDIPVIHLIRNPYDVIKSQAYVKFPWLYDLSRFASQPKLVNLIKSHYDFDITNYKDLSNLEVLCLRWCIENVVPLELMEGYQKKAAVVRYEDLYADIDNFYKLCEDFEVEPVNNVQQYYRLPSTKTTSSGIQMQKQHQQQWEAEELHQINRILTIFQSQLYPKQS